MVADGPDTGNGGRQEGGQNAQLAQLALGQQEGETAPAPGFTLGLDGAVVEGLAYLTVFLHYSPTIHEPEAMAFMQLIVEYMPQLVFGNAATVILDRHFDKVAAVGGLNDDPSPTPGELAGVVGQRVDHEEGECLVGLDHEIGILHAKLYAVHGKGRAALAHQGEQRHQRKAFNVQAQLSAPQLYPMGKHIVVFIYLVGQLGHVSVAPLTHGQWLASA